MSPMITLGQKPSVMNTDRVPYNKALTASSASASRLARHKANDWK